MKEYINVYAWFAQNLGDDLMVDMLAKHFPKYNFYTERKTKNPFLLKNKNFRDKDFYTAKYEKIGKFVDKFRKQESGSFAQSKIKQIEDNRFCSILIGGSVFMQRGELSEAQVNARMRRNNSYLNHGPLFVIGANFGAYYTDYFKDCFEEHFKKCKGISFRDMLSFDMFCHLPNVNYSPDLIFALDNLPKGKENTNEILISVIDISAKYGIEKYAESYETFIADFCKYVIDLGKTPVLMSFCQFEGDEKAINRILTRIGEYASKAKTYFYDGDMRKALQRIADSEFVLASRFHAMVLAILFKKRFYALSYDMKIDNVLNDIKSNLYCKVEELDKITPKSVFESELDFSDVSNYIQMAKGHFAQLEKYLENR